MNQIVELPAGIASEARILNVKQAAELLGLSVVHLRRLYRKGQVPKPITIGARKMGWRTSTLTNFIAAKANENTISEAA